MTAIASTPRVRPGNAARCAAAGTPPQAETKPKTFGRGTLASASTADGNYPTTFQPQRQWWPQQQQQQQRQWGSQHQAPQPQHWQHLQAHRYPQQASAYNGLTPVMYGLWNHQPAVASKVEAAGAIVDVLLQNGVRSRMGGSLAARAYGGIREPMDIDLEVSTSADLERTYQALARLDNFATMPNGAQVRMQATPGSMMVPGRGALVNLVFTYPNGQQQQHVVDVTNENGAEVFPNMLSPAQRGMPETPGNMIAPQLVAGFLSRSLDDPDYSAGKQDIQQIAALIRHAGIDPNSQIAYFDLVNAIGAQFMPEKRQAAEYRMREILTAMTTGRL